MVKKKFKSVDPKVDFVALEEKLLKSWSTSGLVEKYLERNKNSKKRFSFLDGPITANNPMGVHHAWGRTLKDFYQRYKNMRGFSQRFQNGFDNQGLWVEVEVEKELGFKNKQDIEEYGIGKFVEKCKKRTLKFSQVQTEQSQRLGYFMDWDNSYFTMSENNNYMIWHFLKTCHKHGWLYKGRDSVPWCPRCGTAISQHEILTEEYQKITHQSIYFGLPIEGKKAERFLVWTTTPWTLPGNVALAVHPDLEYWLVKGNTGIGFWILSSLAKKVFGGEVEVLKKVKGKKLVGLKYSAPFDSLPAVKKAKETKPDTFHLVLSAADLVNDKEGTGIVHLAPGAGAEDFKLGKETGLPVIEIIDEAANYLPGFGDLSGKNAKTEPKLVLEHSLLKEKVGQPAEDYIFEVKPFTHRYPVCWRCKEELVWRVVDEWYISMGAKKDEPGWKADSLRERMAKVTKKIKWIPEFGEKRELDWLKNMDDWLISKKRYWGLALPIWECQCGHFEVIGSREELKEKAVEGWKEFEGQTPHRPWVDKVRIECSKCGGLASRILDVGSPWLDAGVVPFSTLTEKKKEGLNYTGDKKYWRTWFPADFITEDLAGQFKNWFYSLIAMSTVLENSHPFKTLLGHGLVRDEKGEAMHKSKGNSIEFNQAAREMGVDVMRWIYLSHSPALNLNFGFNLADKTRRRFHLTLWNVYNYLVTYANLNSWQPKTGEKIEKSALDNWILARLNRLVASVTEKMDLHAAHLAAQEIEIFVNDLSTWYLRLSRSRMALSASNKKDQEAALATLHQVLIVLSRILAPFNPFLTEEIFINLTGETSVHLADWPQVEGLGQKKRDLLRQMEWVRIICEQGHSLRKKVAIKVRQPLSGLTVRTKRENLNLSQELIDLIKQELNIKEIKFRFGQGEEEFEIELETKLNQKLIEEGEIRELARQIQILRKEKDCRLDEKIEVVAPLMSKDKNLIDWLKRQTLTIKIVQGKKLTVRKAS